MSGVPFFQNGSSGTQTIWGIPEYCKILKSVIICLPYKQVKAASLSDKYVTICLSERSNMYMACHLFIYLLWNLNQEIVEDFLPNIYSHMCYSVEHLC